MLYNNYVYAPVAQWIELFTPNEEAGGSIPPWCTKEVRWAYAHFASFLFLVWGIGPARARALTRASSGGSSSEWSAGDRFGSQGHRLQKQPFDSPLVHQRSKMDLCPFYFFFVSSMGNRTREGTSVDESLRWMVE